MITMKKILINLWNRIFNRNKKFIVWSATSYYNHCNNKVMFTYFITYFPHKTNKYVLDCNPREHHGDKKHHYSLAKWNLQDAYPKALKKLEEFQSSELIDLITLPKIEGIKA